MASSVPGLRSLPESRYDLSTYWGRVRHCAEVSDPRQLLNTKKDIEEARKLISGYKNGAGPMTPELWRAKRALDSTLHPDTGVPVTLPFRMSSYVLSNLVVTVGMLTPGMGNVGTVFWQWVNQSLNVAVNTANANKSHPLTIQQLLTNYALAVTGSCSVALGLNAVVPRLRVAPHTKQLLGRLVPFAAVASAGIVNVFLMRSEEIRHGISVFDKDHKDLGSSRTAAKYAVGETAASRVINAAPVMALPALVLLKLQKGVLKGKSNLAVTLANLGLITVTSFAALPFALAIFPQKQHIDVSKLEDRFHGLKDSTGNEIKEVYFNRGI
ncbi:sideroflexin Fsf1p [Trichomonascus vanleenenianus]|uniref:Fsf1p n=1 Tax=Trichomonascus vanleenenianus TaxID=2268995 RepID=UPI003ECB8316